MASGSSQIPASPYGGGDPRLQFTVPRRELGDTRGTTRFTDLSGGFDDQRAEQYYGALLTGPTYWEGQNVNVWDLPGKAFLCSRWIRIGSAEVADHEYLLYPFNVAIYRFPTTNFDATLVQKAIAATGTPSWAALANVYPGATAVKNGVEWRGSFYIASGENFLRIMSNTETWTTLAAPGAVGGALAGQVGVGIDDKLNVWWESQGLYTYDGTNWVKIYPNTASVTPNDPYCDLLFMGPGSLQFLTRSSSGVTTWREYSVEPTGTFNASWLAEPGLKVWPQSGTPFQGFAVVVGRLGSSQNVGVSYGKNKLAAPDVIASIDTNLATPNQRGLDWAMRAVFNVGDVLWIGGSSRQDRNCCMYRYEVDADGDIVNPGATISGVGGPIYSLAMLPYAASGANTTERIYASVGSATYYKDSDLGLTVTTDAASGFIQFSDIDLGLEDHRKLWANLTAFFLELSDDGKVEIQYRIDPATPADAWTALCDTQDASTTVDGAMFSEAPSDDETTGDYGAKVRILQIRAVWTAPATGVTRDVWDTLSTKFAALLPLGPLG